MYVCMYVYIYTCIYICTYVYVCIYVCMYVYTYVCKYVCRQIHVYVVSHLVGMNPYCSEAVQVVHYEEGQEYQVHNDWFNPDDPFYHDRTRCLCILI